MEFLDESRKKERVREGGWEEDIGLPQLGRGPSKKWEVMLLLGQRKGSHM